MASALLKLTDVQIGQSVTATNNFTIYQPASPDGTVRWGVGNSGSVTDIVTLNSSGNVGIGTSSPLAKLTVKSATDQNFNVGGASVLADGIRITSTNDANSINLGMQFSGSTFVWVNTGVERMRLDSSGNLGLGVTPSAWYSTIKALQVGTGGLWSLTTGNNATFGSNVYYDASASPTYISSSHATRYQQFNGQHIWYTASSGTAGNAITFTQAMTLDASGNLGIGTSSPTNNANQTSVSINATQVPRLDHYVGGVLKATVQFDTTPVLAVKTLSTDPIALFTNNAERMRIASGGQVCIGTSNTANHVNIYASGGLSVSPTADNASNGLGVCVLGTAISTATSALAKLYMTGANAAHAGSLELRSGSVVNSSIQIYNTGAGRAVLIDPITLSHAGVYSSTVGATNRDVYVDNTGLLGYVSSTRESKTNIQNIDDVSWLSNLNPVTFNRRKKEQITDEYGQTKTGGYTDEYYPELEYGLIAEDVEQVNPEMCFYDEVDGVKKLAGVHYSKLVVPLLKLVQELTARIEQLEAK